MASDKDPTAILVARFIARLRRNLRDASDSEAGKINLLIEDSTRSACDLAHLVGRLDTLKAEDLLGAQSADLINALTKPRIATAGLTKQGVENTLSWADLDLFRTALDRGIWPARGFLLLVARKGSDPDWRNYIRAVAQKELLVDEGHIPLWISDSMLSMPDADFTAELLRIQVACLPDDTLADLAKQVCRFKSDRPFLCLSLCGVTFGQKPSTTPRTPFSEWVTEQMQSGHGRLAMTRTFGSLEDVIAMPFETFRDRRDKITASLTQGDTP